MARNLEVAAYCNETCNSVPALSWVTQQPVLARCRHGPFLSTPRLQAWGATR